MCGIVGYTGNGKAKEVLINGLLSLEYRGYDSAGLALINDNDIHLLKRVGRVNNLMQAPEFKDLSGEIGIAHTRWATHGKPSEDNSHPHFDNSKTYCVVHNGIIENFSDLKHFLEEKGYTFYSQTDTEVIPNLIDYYYKLDDSEDNFDKYLNAVYSTIDVLVGSYALEIISKNYPDTIIATRKDSPLVIGKGTDENFAASDVLALLRYTKNIYFLNDNEYAILTKNDIKFLDEKLNPIEKELKSIDWDADEATKDGYKDFMLKEIHEEPSAIRHTIGDRLKKEPGKEFQEELNFSKEYLESINKIFFVACGTAMHAGLVGKSIIERLCRIPVEVQIASEFRYSNPIVDKNTLCIFVSQSGETADTLAALRLSKSMGAKTLAIANVIGSTITRDADYTIYTMAGPEIAVASTKAYTSQVCLISILGIYFAELLERTNQTQLQRIKRDLIDLPVQIDRILDNKASIQKIAKKLVDKKDIYFLGRQTDYCAALEGSLKLKEISYIHSEAYAAGELKHGPIALIEDNVSVIGIMTKRDLIEKTISNLQEVITRGAKTFVVTNQTLPKVKIDYIFKIPKTNELISPILSVIPLQLLAYYVAKEKGLDVDKPRNLAKSVTVE